MVFPFQCDNSGVEFAKLRKVCLFVSTIPVLMITNSIFVVCYTSSMLAMLPVLSPEQMQKADEYAISSMGVPGIVLMENAAAQSAEIIISTLQKRGYENPDILVLCGSGNNGGDGFAIARHLFSRNFQVRVLWTGNELAMKPETRLNLSILQQIGVPLRAAQDEAQAYAAPLEADCIIDALIGTGGTAALRGIPLILLRRLREKKKRALHVAIDMPSGIDGLTGQASEFAFQADITCTMLADKLGMWLFPAHGFCGSIERIGLGIPLSAAALQAEHFMLEKQDILRLYGKRNPVSAKWDYGRVLIIAGSAPMPGAAVLCAHAALMAGAGLVELCSTMLHPALRPEIMPHILPGNDQGQVDINVSAELLLQRFEKADSIICGPGLGRQAGKDIVELLHKYYAGPVLLDADAIPAMGEYNALPSHWVLTPHAGEFARLTGMNRQNAMALPFSSAAQAAAMCGATIHFKAIPSITHNGSKGFLCVHGNPGMATAGSGDVLAGIAGALLARLKDPLLAMSAAAYIHACAGDHAAAKVGYESLMAGDIVDSMNLVLR
jgi:NAD(P)H-hydrate epimerase